MARTIDISTMSIEILVCEKKNLIIREDDLRERVSVETRGGVVIYLNCSSNEERKYSLNSYREKQSNATVARSKKVQKDHRRGLTSSTRKTRINRQTKAT